MTDHPAAGCTPRQIEVFEQIATGQHVGHNPRVLNALASKGLIQFNTRTVGRDVLGLITIQEPFVPLPLHYQFCTWASEQPEDEFESDLIS